MRVGRGFGKMRWDDSRVARYRPRPESEIARRSVQLEAQVIRGARDARRMPECIHTIHVRRVGLRCRHWRRRPSRY